MVYAMQDLPTCPPHLSEQPQLSIEYDVGTCLDLDHPHQYKSFKDSILP